VHHCTLISPRVRYRLCPCGTPPEPDLHRLSPDNRSPGHCLPGAVSVSPNVLAGRRPAGLGRRRELHPPAPIAAAPALLEACGYSVCLVPGWRPETCRGGAPTCPCGRVCFAVGGPLAEPSCEGSMSGAPCTRITPDFAGRFPCHACFHVLV
jgi:hypothetical protein